MRLIHTGLVNLEHSSKAVSSAQGPRQVVRSSGINSKLVNEVQSKKALLAIYRSVGGTAISRSTAQPIKAFTWMVCSVLEARCVGDVCTQRT